MGSNIETKRFNTFEELVKYMLKPGAKLTQSDTVDKALSQLEAMFKGGGTKEFVVYKVGTGDLKVPFDDSKGDVKAKVYSPVGKTGFSIEGRSTHIVNCTVKDCYIGASSGDYNNIQEIYIKGLNCDNCTIGFSAVGTQVERLTVEDIDLWNQELDTGGICVNLSGMDVAFLNVKNIKSYNSRCGINLSSNNFTGGQDGYLIENLVCYYSDRWTSSVPSNYYSALRLYDSSNPIKIINCDTNAPRMITSDGGVTCSTLSIQNCRSLGAYDTHITLEFPVNDLSIKDCNFTDTYVTAYAVSASAGANIDNFSRYPN
jgi:hypothetical protein